MKPLAVTCGDPAGVGPEVVLGALAKLGQGAPAVCLIGPEAWLASAQEQLGQLDLVVEAVGDPGFSATPGEPSEDGAAVALAALEAAAEGCRVGRFSGAVTGPVSKLWMGKVGFRFPGQTEFFADRWGGEPVMAFAGGRLRVVLATWHIPLREVPDALDEATLRRSVLAAADLARSLGTGDVPRIGVCGLNPHAGEAGLLGTEERDRLDPWLDAWRGEMPGLSRCLPGDTVFQRALEGDFDAVVALYHDQGLGPVKTLEFHESVNITLGLPWVRTSPDHGTAFGIAGAGQARCESMVNALQLGEKLAHYREPKASGITRE